MHLWSVQDITDALNSLGWIGYVCGAILVLVQTIFPFIPFVVVAGVNVLLFGFWAGFAVNYIFACLGAIGFYFVAKNLGRAWMQKKLAKYKYLGSFNDVLHRHGLLVIIISRIIPIMPSIAINLVAAFMRVRSRHFILGTLIGKLPMIWFESLIGHDLLYFEENKGRLAILLAIFVIMLLIGNVVRNKWMKPDHKKVK